MNNKSHLLQQLRKDSGQNRIQSLAFVISVSICICLSIAFAVSSLSRSQQLYEIKLQRRINPNTAQVASLVRLPGIGISRASAIVAYRRDFAGQKAGRAAFETADDLQKVRGIGPKTVQNISRWLKFE